jgi:hypothetical protein
VTEQEIALTLSQYIVGNWGTVISSLGAFTGGVATLTWFIFNTIHKKETEVLLQRISLHEDNFEQFSAIMEQRLALAESFAKELKDKLSNKHESYPPRTKKSEVYEFSFSEEEPPVLRRSDVRLKPSYAIRKSYNEQAKIGELIDRVSSLSTALDNLNTLIN